MKKFLSYILVPKFSYADAVALLLMGIMIADGNWIAGIIVWSVCCISFEIIKQYVVPME